MTGKSDDGPIIGKPIGRQPISDADHFMVCPVCGEIFDMRDPGQAFEHLHDGPESPQ
jgi:hypothetical protein